MSNPGSRRNGPVKLHLTGILKSLIQLQSVYGITRRSIRNKVLDFSVVFIFFQCHQPPQRHWLSEVGFMQTWAKGQLEDVSLQSRDQIGTGRQVMDCSHLFDNDLPDK
eukprot:XP_024306314.1 uncharacterized protein LOC107984974 isoform X5 [Homo sapiens]